MNDEMNEICFKTRVRDKPSKTAAYLQPITLVMGTVYKRLSSGWKPWYIFYVAIFNGFIN